jgi:hypothetical protein
VKGLTWRRSRGVAAVAMVMAAVAGTMFAVAQDFDGASASSKGRDLAVTVYNDNLGLVKDRRTVSIARGTLAFTDVAAQLDPTSVHIRPVGKGTLEVLTQDYRNDLAGTDRLFERYLDRPIEVRLKGTETRRGTLMAVDGASLVIRTDDGTLRVVTRSEVQEVLLAAQPSNLASGPTLTWRVHPEASGPLPVEVSYLTGGLTWHAEYVAIQNESGSSLDLTGWATVENSSGETYENAKLKLIAGSIHRAATPRPPMPYETMARADVMNQKLAERGFSEYHLYELPDRATVANNSVKQLGLMSARAVPVTRKFVYDVEKNADQVMTTLEFKNESSAGIGMPLPAGTVRVYQRDRDGALEFTGEDRIAHTAKNETGRVAVGGVFDVAVERKQTDFQQTSPRETQATVEVTLRNHRDKAIDVTVVEHAYGDWEIVKSSHPSKKKDATSFEFSVRCAPEQPVTLSYTIRTRLPGSEPR